MATLDQYRQATGPVPEAYHAWQLFGAGFEHVGRNGKAVPLELREPSANEILCRVDAVGLCLSDIKLIRQGGSHARLRGQDLSVEPTVLGHECSVTVIRAGADWRDRFEAGQRYIVQADIFVDGVGYAFGYAIPGGLGQYCYFDERALDGDEGCYLLDVNPETGYSQAALAEPWACVEMSYCVEDRLTPGDSQLTIVDDDSAKWHQANPDARILAGSLEGLTDERLNDVIVPEPKPATVTELASRMRNGSTMFLLGRPEEQGAVALDIGRVHYENIRVFGGGDDIEEVRAANERHDLLPDGSALFLGAGGPMGQMHVQRAIELEAGSKLVVMTDLDQSRLDHIARRFEALAKAKGVALHALSPESCGSQEAMDEQIRDLVPGGYSDVCVLAPATELVASAMGFATDNGLVNVFAGIPIGNPCDIQLADLCRGIAIIGSSGSRISDLRRILEMVESGRLDTNRSVAAIGGLESAFEGLEGVRDGRCPGKIVIYPHVRNLPLTALEDIPKNIPELAGKLGPDCAWTKEAETALLERFL